MLYIFSRLFVLQRKKKKKTIASFYTELKTFPDIGTDLLIQPQHQLRSSFGTFTHRGHPKSTTKHWIFPSPDRSIIKEEKYRVQKMLVDFGEAFWTAPFFLQPSPCANIAKLKDLLKHFRGWSIA